MQSQERDRSAVSSWVAALRGPRAISLTATLIVGIVSFLPTFSLERLQYPTVSDALLATAALTFASAAVLLVADRTVLRNRKSSPVPLATVFVVYILTGAVRPLASLATSRILGGQNSDLDTIRVVQAILVTALSLGVLAIVLDANDRQLAAIRLLSNENQELRTIRERNKESLTLENQQLSSAIRDEAVISLKQLAARLRAVSRTQLTPAILQTCAAEIRQTIDDFVRPLARRALAPTTIEDVRHPVPRAEPASKWSTIGDLIRNSFVVDPFPAIALPAALFVTYLASLPSRYGGMGWAWTFLNPLVAFLILTLYRRLLPDWRLRTFTPAVRVIVVVGAIVVMAFLVVFTAPTILGLVYGFIPTDTTWLLSGFIVITFYWALFTIGTAAVKRRHVIETDLRSTRAALQFELQQQQVQLDQIREALSDYLHGEVQARLASAALSLEIAANALRETSDATLATSAIAEATATVDRITEAAASMTGLASAPSFVDAIDEVAHLWRGLIDISVSVADAALAVIAQSPACATTVVSLAGESITNAVKHGAAERVDITINLDGDAIVFEAIDDGIGPPTTVEPGIGLSKNLRGALRWELRRGPAGGAELYVALPARM